MTRREPLAAVLLFSLVAVLFAPDAATGEGVFWHHDLRHHHYPWRVWAADQWRQGIVPWWSSQTANGYPLLAEGEGGFLYPLTMLLFVLLPSGLAMDWTILGHQVIGAMGVYVWLRTPAPVRNGPTGAALSPAGAWLAGLTFAFSGLLISHTLYLGMQNALAWLGWALWGTRAQRWPVVAIAIGMMGLAGHPQAAAFGGLLCALDAARHGLQATRPVAFLMKWGAAAMAGALIASPQLVASLQLSQFSMRDGGVDTSFANIGKLPALEVFNFVLPALFGFDRPVDIEQTYYHRGLSYWGSGEDSWEMCFYLGFPVVVLALLGLKREKWWAGVAAVAMLLMLGTPLWGLVRHLPGFGFFRFPVRFSIWFTLALAVLAGHGIDRLRASRDVTFPSRLVQLSAFVLLIGFVLGGLGIRSQEQAVRSVLTRHYMAKTELPALPPGVSPPASDPLHKAALAPPELITPAQVPAKVDQIFNEIWLTTSLLSTRIWTPFFFLVLTGACLGRPRALIAVVALDLWVFGHDYHPRVPEMKTRERPVWLQPEMTEMGGFRTAILDRRIRPELDGEVGTASLNLLWGSNEVLIPSPLLILRNDAMLGIAGMDVGETGAVKVERYNAYIDIARRMAVKWVVSTWPITGVDLLRNGAIQVGQDDDTLPRARMVPCRLDVAVPDQGPSDENPPDESAVANAIFAAMPTTAPRLAVLVEHPEDAACVGVGDEPGVGASWLAAAITSYSEQQVEITATGPGTLVLADTWYPGWSASIDGEKSPIIRADLLFRAVDVPEGVHTVRFQFDPGLPGTLLWPASGLLAAMLTWALALSFRRSEMNR